MTEKRHIMESTGGILDIFRKSNYYKTSECVAETCEACDRGRTCGGSSFSYIKCERMKMRKTFLTYDQQVNMLINEKGLIIADKEYAGKLGKDNPVQIIGGL